MLFQSETVAVEKDADGSAFLKIDVPGQTHNMISRQVLADLDAALDRVAAEPRLPLLVVRSGKPAGFLAGADLHGFLEIADETAAAALSERRANGCSPSWRRCPCRRSPPFTAPVSAAAWSWPWPATTGLSSTTPKRSSACRK